MCFPSNCAAYLNHRSVKKRTFGAALPVKKKDALGRDDKQPSLEAVDSMMREVIGLQIQLSTYKNCLLTSSKNSFQKSKIRFKTGRPGGRCG